MYEWTTTKFGVQLLKKMKDYRNWASEPMWGTPLGLTDDIDLAIRIVSKLMESPWKTMTAFPGISEIFVSDGDFVYKAIYHFETGEFEIIDDMAEIGTLLYWMPIPAFPENAEEQKLGEEDEKFLQILQNHANWAKEQSTTASSELAHVLQETISLIRTLNCSFWNPVSELPSSKTCCTMDVYVTDCHSVCVAQYHFKNGVFQETNLISPVQYWMPIPELPRKDS